MFSIVNDKTKMTFEDYCKVRGIELGNDSEVINPECQQDNIQV